MEKGKSLVSEDGNESADLIEVVISAFNMISFFDFYYSFRRTTHGMSNYNTINLSLQKNINCCY